MQNSSSGSVWTVLIICLLPIFLVLGAAFVVAGMMEEMEQKLVLAQGGQCREERVAPVARSIANFMRGGSPDKKTWVCKNGTRFQM